MPNVPIRCLFSRREMGIERYEEVREDIVTKWVKDPVAFKENFKIEFLYEGCNSVKFEKGFKDFLHVLNNDENDMKILKGALNTLIQKQKESNSKNKYSFGPVIMRAFHFLDMPNEALEVSILLI